MSQNNKKKQTTVRRRARLSLRYYDYNLLAGVILLTCFGLVMLYSTSAYEAEANFGDDMFYFRKQALISAACLVMVLIGSQIDYHIFVKFAPALYVVANILLIITKYVGTEAYGAKRWLKFGPLSFQPAELAKVAIILYLPMVIVKLGRNMKGIKAPAVVLGLGAFTSFCTFYFTDNLSTALIIAGITVILIFVAHPQTKPFVIGGTALFVAVVAGVRYFASTLDGSDNFRLRRLIVWLDPEAYSEIGGYQILQALYAIGSGGFFGKGLGNSTQKLSALPEAQNDTIFAVICEELGVFGAAMLTLMFVFLLYRLLFIAQNAPDLLGSLIVTGIFAHIALQVILNIMVVINLIPTTGITLPFVSYGGTSVLFLMVEMAIALSVSRQIRLKEEEDPAKLQEEYVAGRIR
ncbi:MAG: FtsW/RodA/SpoVE family cell cycle protein [Eubacteriales bacterium]|nr:FtsW/RodA/SpoVE family cell cycle protein [Eubacteriales bacterium]